MRSRKTADQRVEAVVGFLRKGDREQLLFQVGEIVAGEAYKLNGISLRHDSVVIDVGANFGVAALYFALVCEVREVYSLEPAPAAFKILQANVHDVPAVRCRQLGLAREPGILDLTYYESTPVMSSFHADSKRDIKLLEQAALNMGASPEEARERFKGSLQARIVPCEVTTLSNFIDDESIARVHLLKIDTERSEVEILEGIRTEHWPLIDQVVLETHEHELTRTASRMLAARGFAVQAVQDPLLAGTAVNMVYAHRHGAARGGDS